MIDFQRLAKILFCNKNFENEQKKSFWNKKGGSVTKSYGKVTDVTENKLLNISVVTKCYKCYKVFRPNFPKKFWKKEGCQPFLND